MTIQRFIIGLILALLLQASAFAWRYQDVLYFQQSITSLEQDKPDVFAAKAEEALSREKLTRQNLDTIAAAAQKQGRVDIEIQALNRRLALDLYDGDVRIRLADAMRRGGRFETADALYSDVLRSKQEAR